MRTLTFNRVIGTGAMGTVYHAELRLPRGFTRPCAVKVMKASSPDQEQFRARMRDEARLLGMLQDEQILGVNELVRVEGRDCVVMEYVEGVDLAQVIRDHRIPPKALAELGGDLSGTLHRAHAAVHPATGEPLRVIHRDVKPANVMLTKRGQVRLLDFGVARAAFATRESNTQGLVLGTLNYFPPEILAGAEPTPAVDIYGLGLTLWECATGRDWGTPQVHRHRFERRVDQRMQEMGADYEPVAQVLKKLLQWRPDDRPSAQAVEKLFHTAADAVGGIGLRAWARKTISPLVATRDGEAGSDDLVGKTLQVESMPEVIVPKPIPLQRIDEGLVRRAARRVETETFNDLAPPAAVIRGRGELPPVDSGPIPEIDLDPSTADGPVDEKTRPKVIPPASAATAILVKGEGGALQVPAERVRGRTSAPGSVTAPVSTANAPSVASAPVPERSAPRPVEPSEGATVLVPMSGPPRRPEEPGPSAFRTVLLLAGAAAVGGMVGAGLLLAVFVLGWLVVG